MRPERPSFTAAFVAVCRGLGTLLPASARLVEDPYGARFAGAPVDLLVNALEHAPTALRALLWGPLLPMLPWVIHMQIRTRVIDDALLRFVRGGGRQLVILGAGFDARASRLGEVLRDVAVFEVDHPATQARKRTVLGETRSSARYLAWDFERDPMDALPARLAEVGHDSSRATFTIWEGVTMYLSREALAATVDAVKAYSATGSWLVFNYAERAVIERPGVAEAAVNRVVSVVGEPFKSGFDPVELRAWMRAHGFALRDDRSFVEFARELLPAPWPTIARGSMRIALAERDAKTAS